MYFTMQSSLCSGWKQINLFDWQNTHEEEVTKLNNSLVPLRLRINKNSTSVPNQDLSSQFISKMLRAEWPVWGENQPIGHCQDFQACVWWRVWMNGRTIGRELWREINRTHTDADSECLWGDPVLSFTGEVGTDSIESSWHFTKPYF